MRNLLCMKYVPKLATAFAASFSLFFCLNSCSKSSPDPAAPADPCAGKTISITATPTISTGCSNNGSVQVSASGSTGFTYKLGTSGIYQPSGSFTNVVAGSYTVFAKDGAGCQKTTTVTVGGGSSGPLFNHVKSLISAKCQSCHNNSIQNGGMNFAVDCNIVTNQGRIKVRAVDEGTMPIGAPPLTTSERAIITDWINAGGRLTD